MQVQHEQSHERSNEEIIEALQRQVNELKTANLALQEQLERREQFNAMVAHELRGPLTPIINYAELLLRPDLKPEATQKRARIIISQARRLERLVNDLHDASRLSSGQFTLNRTPCDIAALAREVVEQLSPLAPYHKFSIETPATTVTGNWDCGRLQQVLGNLLDNAIKYSDEGSTITVRITICGQSVEPEEGQETKKVARVSVHNQGIAIPPAEIGQLFRPYGRLQSSAGHQGSGLGLYIAKCIVDTHGGTLQLEPPGPETSGTTFSFDLPM
ncbi:MAG TPA: HAMP domain-containing sensor histidine kinase [Ktedonobacteraceae bacterium]|nr:HAMP domain-containing sensor histidine kinase [Ktedonobacteraceae bacterium]